MLQKFKNIIHKKDEVYLRIKARPDAAKTVITQILDDDTIKIDVAAPPLKGKANQELVRFIAKEFAVDKKCVKIITGKQEKIKLVKIEK